jgi:hypothetical protein
MANTEKLSRPDTVSPNSRHLVDLICGALRKNRRSRGKTNFFLPAFPTFAQTALAIISTRKTLAR